MDWSDEEEFDEEFEEGYYEEEEDDFGEDEEKDFFFSDLAMLQMIYLQELELAKLQALKKQENEKKERKERKGLQEDASCSICHEDMTESELGNGLLVYCEFGCGKNVHTRCMLEWAKHCCDASKSVECPLCRTTWGGREVTLELEKTLQDAETKARRNGQFVERKEPAFVVLKQFDLPCKFFNTPQGCRRGTACKFKHVRSDNVNQQIPCRFFKTPRGCSKGENCPYSHVQIPVCHFYSSRKGCRNGDHCRFAHVRVPREPRSRAGSFSLAPSGAEVRAILGELLFPVVDMTLQGRARLSP